MKKILFISQWYPHRYDKMFGLFVQKHAQAVSLYCEVKVLYIQADSKISKLEIIETTNGNIQEFIVYYPAKNNSAFERAQKFINYFNAYRIGYQHIEKSGFIPDIVHSNILTRNGAVALCLKIFKHIPYTITEHWSRYLPMRNSYAGFLRKIITPIIVKNASAVLPVSESLKNAMINHKLINANYTVVNNVVDDFFFENTAVVERTKKRILHVSCFDEKAKNVKGILRVAGELAKKRQDFEFVFIGDGIDFEEVVAFSETLSFPKEMIYFIGQKTPREVANWLQNSDFFVLFSNYETAGVVIAESLVSGKPVVSTKVGAAPEYINKNNGIIIDIGNEKALEESIIYILEHINEYNAIEIKAEANNKFSYKSVGKQLFEIYNKVLN